MYGLRRNLSLNAFTETGKVALYSIIWRSGFRCAIVRSTLSWNSCDSSLSACRVWAHVVSAGEVDFQELCWIRTAVSTLQCEEHSAVESLYEGLGSDSLPTMPTESLQADPP